MTSKRYTCPCCGYLSIEDRPGSYSICSVCHWEDDPVQMLNPWFSGGANKPSLVEAQENFRRYGHCNGPAGKRGPRPAGLARDPAWRPARESDRQWIRRPRDISNADWRNASAWYYWRRNA